VNPRRVVVERLERDGDLFERRVARALPQPVDTDVRGGGADLFGMATDRSRGRTRRTNSCRYQRNVRGVITPTVSETTSRSAPASWAAR